MISDPNAKTKLECPTHGDAPFLIVEADDHKKTYCLVCFDEVMKRLGVRSMYPVKVEPKDFEWPEKLEIEDYG